MRTAALTLMALCVSLPAAARGQGQQEGHRAETPSTRKAIAVLHHLGTSKAHGIVTFTQQEGYIEITGHIEGLTPGEHAFHVHEFGDCSSPDGMSAGGHFNPEHMPHGAPDAEKRHVGDLGNITADQDGRVTLNMRDTVLQLHGRHSIIGRSLIVHEKRDDFGQPVGNAGGRVACGVVGIAKP
jgi:Cu-Zn family superoxide dismutase